MRSNEGLTPAFVHLRYWLDRVAFSRYINSGVEPKIRVCSTMA